MKNQKLNILFFFLLLVSQKALSQNVPFVLVKNTGGQTLAYSPNSGVKILTIKGLSFKDLNKNGILDKYEDWRLPYDVRAKDLASKLSIEQIAGLMLYSSHQSLPARAGGYFAGTYNGKPVVVSINISNPMVFSEVEKSADAIVLSFGVQDQAQLDIFSGKVEPSGLLPMQMPADMTTVEKQAEDAPQDMKCHTDTEGGTYDFGFGRNWKGVIKDARTIQFVKPAKLNATGKMTSR